MGAQGSPSVNFILARREVPLRFMAPKAKASAAPEVDADVAAAREKLAAKFGAVRTGGKGSVRRKNKKNIRTGVADDKALQAQFTRLGVNNIPGIEEVNMFKDDGTVLHFQSPKVQASITANTYVVSGHGENKQLQELLPGILSQLGPDNLMNLKRIAEQMGANPGGSKDDDDDDVPDLIDENFEDVSKK